MNAARLARFALVAGLLLLAGCATQKHANDVLQTTLYDYSGAIRWNRPDAAARFLDPEIESIQPTPLMMQRFEQVQVTGYSVRGTEQVSETKYAQLVEIRLINKHTQTERTVLDEQVWRYDEEKRQWWIMSGLPNLTPR